MVLLIVSIVFAVLLICFLMYNSDREITYTIKKGNHRASNNTTKLLNGDGIIFKCTFDESAEYKSVNPVNQYDVNKLMGFSDCNSHHHKNSARFGWRWLNDGVEILAYVYNNGVRLEPQVITKVQPNEIHIYNVWAEVDEYVFKVDGLEMRQPRVSGCPMFLSYKLFPYFGGDETAPHEIKIKIQEVNFL